MIAKIIVEIRSALKNLVIRIIYSTAGFVQNCFFCAYLTEFIASDGIFAISMQKMAKKIKRVIF